MIYKQASLIKEGDGVPGLAGLQTVTSVEFKNGYVKCWLDHKFVPACYEPDREMVVFDHSEMDKYVRIYHTQEEQERWRKREYSHFRLEDGAPALEKLQRDWWTQLDSNLQNLAIEYLSLVVEKALLTEIRNKHYQYGDDWMDHMWEEELDPELAKFYTFHHSDGMGIRNLLRDVIPDNSLPSGNWDDFYIVATLEASKMVKD